MRAVTSRPPHPGSGRPLPAGDRPGAGPWAPRSAGELRAHRTLRAPGCRRGESPRPRAVAEGDASLHRLTSCAEPPDGDAHRDRAPAGRHRDRPDAAPGDEQRDPADVAAAIAAFWSLPRSGSSVGRTSVTARQPRVIRTSTGSCPGPRRPLSIRRPTTGHERGQSGFVSPKMVARARSQRATIAGCRILRSNEMM